MTGPAGSPTVRIYRPPPALESWLTFSYVVACPGPLTDFLYPEWVNVRFAITGDWFVDLADHHSADPHRSIMYGPTDQRSLVRTAGGCSLGFGLTPLGWARLFGGDAARLANRVEPLGDRLGIDGEALRALLIADMASDETAAVARIEGLIAERLATTPALPPVVLAIDAALRTRPDTIGDFAERAGVTERTLHRMCRRTFGFSPKRLMRLQRFLDVLGEARSAVGRPVNAALGEAYYDQSHFYRDFRDFMGMTPRAYFSAPRPLMAAAAEAQMRAGVTLSFRLPPQPDAL